MTTRFTPPMLSNPNSAFGETSLAFANLASGDWEYFWNDFQLGRDIDTTATVGQWGVTDIGATPTAPSFTLSNATTTRGSCCNHDPGTDNSKGTSIAGAGFDLGPTGTARNPKIVFAARGRKIVVASLTSAVGLSNGAAMLGTTGALGTGNALQLGLHIPTTGLATFFLGNTTTNVTVAVPTALYANGTALANLEFYKIVIRADLGLANNSTWSTGAIYCYFNGKLVSPSTRPGGPTFLPTDATIAIASSRQLYNTMDAVNAAAAVSDAQYDYLGWALNRY